MVDLGSLRNQTRPELGFFMGPNPSSVSRRDAAKSTYVAVLAQPSLTIGPRDTRHGVIVGAMGYPRRSSSGRTQGCSPHTTVDVRFAEVLTW